MKLSFALIVFFTIGTGAIGRAAPASRLEDYYGKWQILLHGTDSTFRACCLILGPDGNKVSGKAVVRWGSVEPIGEGQIKLGDDGVLRVTRGDWPAPLEVVRVGDMLEGTMKQKDGKAFEVIGTRAVDAADVTGTWDIGLDPPDSDKTGVLKIREDGAGRIDVKATGHNGEDVPVDEASLQGNRLTVTFDSKDKSGGPLKIRLEAEVRGDRLTGKASRADALGESRSVKGERRRSWGKPVTLLKGNGLSGWRARDARAKFGWTITDGVLTNNPPDVDIVSDAVFKDFKLHLEYKVAEHGNSGVYLRGRYEVQILDDFGKGVESHGNGAVYSLIPQRKNVSKAPDTWQTYDITLIDRYVTVTLNGETIIDNERLESITGGALDPFESQPGPLMLQGDHGKVAYRNVVVTPALSD